jgi:hypothetical protein
MNTDLTPMSFDEFWMTYDSFKKQNEEEIYNFYVKCLKQYKLPFKAYMLLLDADQTGTIEDFQDDVQNLLESRFKNTYIKKVHTEEDLVDYALNDLLLPSWLSINYEESYGDLINDYEVIECENGKSYYFTIE